MSLNSVNLLFNPALLLVKSTSAVDLFNFLALFYTFLLTFDMELSDFLWWIFSLLKFDDSNCYTFLLIVLDDDFLELLCCCFLFDSVFDFDLDLSNVCKVKFLDGFVYMYNNGLGEMYRYDWRLYFRICFIKSSTLLYVCLCDFLDSCLCMIYLKILCGCFNFLLIRVNRLLLFFIFIRVTFIIILLLIF